MNLRNPFRSAQRMHDRHVYCGVFWGSHGCSRKPGRHHIHVCTAFDSDGEPVVGHGSMDEAYPEVFCSELDDRTGKVRHNHGSHPPEWGTWMDSGGWWRQ